MRSTTNPTALASRRLDWKREGGRTVESALSRSDWVCLNVRLNNTGMLASLPKLPAFSGESPQILNAMRYAYQEQWWTDSDSDEFYWFSREYGRVLRHHFGNIDYRLGNIYKLYSSAHELFSKNLATARAEQFGFAFSDMSCLVTHWEFESFLSAAGSSLDLMARLVGPAYLENTPTSFSKLCKKSHLEGYVDTLREAEKRWVHKLKAYRDCFVHYTPSETALTYSVVQRGGESHVHFSIPVNPNSRDITLFRWSVNRDLLRTAIDFRRKLHALDRRIAVQMRTDHSNEEFPIRRTHLLQIGRRT